MRSQGTLIYLVFIVLYFGCIIECTNIDHDSLHAWWIDRFLVVEDEAGLKHGDNIVLGLIGNHTYLQYAVESIIQSYHIGSRAVLHVNVSEQESSDAIIQKVHSRVKNGGLGRHLVVLTGGERLKNDMLHNLDVLFSIPDNTYGLADTVAVLAWDIDHDVEYDLYKSKKPLELPPDNSGSNQRVGGDGTSVVAEYWANYLIHRLQSRTQHVNGAAIMGRIRRLGIQNRFLPLIHSHSSPTVEDLFNQTPCIYRLLFLVISTLYLLWLRNRPRTSTSTPIYKEAVGSFTEDNDGLHPENPVSSNVAHSANGPSDAPTFAVNNSDVKDSPFSSPDVTATGKREVRTHRRKSTSMDHRSITENRGMVTRSKSHS